MTMIQFFGTKKRTKNKGGAGLENAAYIAVLVRVLDEHLPRGDCLPMVVKRSILMPLSLGSPVYTARNIGK